MLGDKDIYNIAKSVAIKILSSRSMATIAGISWMDILEDAIQEGVIEILVNLDGFDKARSKSIKKYAAALASRRIKSYIRSIQRDKRRLIVSGIFQGCNFKVGTMHKIMREFDSARAKNIIQEDCDDTCRL